MSGLQYRVHGMTLYQLARKHGINYATIRTRYGVGDRGERLIRPVAEYPRPALVAPRSTPP